MTIHNILQTYKKTDM